jgi:GntR family transcriptional regulator
MGTGPHLAVGLGNGAPSPGSRRALTLDRLSGQPGVQPETIIRQRGGVPLYMQVAEEILAAIEAGRLEPGDRVASEPELVRAYGVSRATAAKALERLEQSGHVRREQGRGTFVEAPRLLQRRPELGSFSESVRRGGHVPAQRLLDFERLGADSADALAGWLEAVPLVRIVRLRLVDGEPVGVHSTLLPEVVAERAHVDEEHLRGEGASLYALLDAAGVHVREADEHLQAVAATAEEAQLLGVEPGTALMRVLRVSRDARGVPMEVVDARYVGARFDYSVSLVRSRAGAGTGKESNDEDQAPGSDRAVGRTAGHGGRVRQGG